MNKRQRRILGFGCITGSVLLGFIGLAVLVVSAATNSTGPAVFAVGLFPLAFAGFIAGLVVLAGGKGDVALRAQPQPQHDEAVEGRAKRGSFRESFRVYVKSAVFTLPLAAAATYLSKDRLWYSAEQLGDFGPLCLHVLTTALALYWRRTPGFVAYLALGLLATGIRYAQSWERLHTANRAVIYSGCINTAPAGMDSDAWAQFCSCYGDEVLAEFRPRELTAVAESMSSGAPDPRLKDLGERCWSRANAAPLVLNVPAATAAEREALAVIARECRVGDRPYKEQDAHGWGWKTRVGASETCFQALQEAQALGLLDR